MWSERYTPVYQKMLKANALWLKEDPQGDELFLKACAEMYPKEKWKYRSPVYELTDWAIDERFKERVQQLHRLTDFERVDGFKFYLK